jgi:enterochelin esterase family protein
MSTADSTAESAIAVSAPQDLSVAPSWLAIGRLEARAPLESADVDGFLARHASPIVEGPYATFLWRGEADRVLVRHAVIGFTNPLEMRRVGGTDLWAKTIALPDGSRLEYQLERIDADGSGHRFNDPLNPRLGWGPFGAQSVCAATGYVDPDWAEPDERSEPGRLVDASMTSRSLGRQVEVQVYLPAAFRPGRRWPLLVVHDGSDFLRYSAARTILDNLIHRGEVAPLVGVVVSAGPQRLVEYANDPRHAVFVVRELLPSLFRRFGFLQGPDQRTLMGSSFGGIASLSTASRYPGRFGSLLLESASLVFSGPSTHLPPDSPFAPVIRFVDEYRADPRPVVRRMYLACGAFEPLIAPNRAMVEVFRRAGIEVRYREAFDGHQWVDWRDRLRDALTFLHPGPGVGHNGGQQ